MSTGTDWTVDEMLAEIDVNGHGAAQPAHNGAAWSAWGARVEKRMSAQKTTVDNLAAALRHQLAKERRERMVEVGELRRELSELRRELDLQGRLTEMQARLDRIEGTRSGSDVEARHLRLSS